MAGAPRKFADNKGLIAVVGAFLLCRRCEAPHAHTQDGKTLAFVTGMIPCPLTRS